MALNIETATASRGPRTYQRTPRNTVFYAALMSATFVEQLTDMAVGRQLLDLVRCFCPRPLRGDALKSLRLRSLRSEEKSREKSTSVVKPRP